MIGVIEYGAGNIKSVVNALDALSIEWKVIDNKSKFFNCSHLILPGVGAFGYGVRQLNEKGYIDIIKKHVQEGKMLLGICLGMQLLFDKSYEKGENSGLGLVPGEVKPFKGLVKGMYVPHVGWNDAVKTKESDLAIESAYYFVHSYFCAPNKKQDILLETEYGVKFASAVEKQNVIGYQFHPEKSHKSGLELLKRFYNTKC